MMNIKRASIVFALAAVTCACTDARLIPDQVADGWPTASPAAVGLDVEPLQEAIELINEGTYSNVHSILIVKDGMLVFEQYFPGYQWDFEGEDFRGEYTRFDRDTLHNLASVTKSFTATLIGIAIDRGDIPDVNQRLFDYFPEYASLRNARNADMTLEHLLTMTAGFEWNAIDVALKSTEPPNDVLSMFYVEDPLEFVLGKPMVAEPGTAWYYNGGATVLLGEVIRRSTGQRIDEFAEQSLFAPLGITRSEWFFINPEIVMAAGNLRLRPRDMAKLGQLYLSGGVWEGKRIVSEDWVRVSTEAHSSTFWPSSYGYQWWVYTYESNGIEHEAFYADGWGGQRILVFPSSSMVVVLTGGNYTQPHPLDSIIQRHILPALES